ncbi:MAG: phosphoribosylamine--glycine ligase [Betaproteobacteria bacterium]|nr:phosphoribosylamine--glycine ligase [Betaproteobacteria bacterium]
MKLLVIGGGGREHAIAWRLAQSPRVQTVYVAPGNAGSATESGVKNLAITDISALADFAASEPIHLTVVGPEAPLAAGIVDAFQARGLRIFGPSQACAQLEASKEFAKTFMAENKIPTAAYAAFSDAAAAHAYVESKGAPIVIKADGLAAGKGVVVAANLNEAHKAIDWMLIDHAMGSAGNRVVIEEFLDGEEASFIVMCDGRNILTLATSQDHKRLHDGDLGPNTGGMGAYSPAPVITPKIHSRVMREVIQPVMNGMAARGTPYSGFLYAGLMIDSKGELRVLEFNCRLGDPETQPIMLRLKSDLFELIECAVEGKLEATEVDWDRRAALGVVLAAHGYPETPRKGDVIAKLPAAAEDFHVFQAGTVLHEGKVLTDGGRVLCVTALGESIKIAQRRAYQVIDEICFPGMQFRRDIGHRAVAPRHS